MAFKINKYYNSLLFILVQILLISSCKLDEELRYIQYANNTEDTIVVFASPQMDTSYVYSSYSYGCNEIKPMQIASAPYLQDAIKDSIILYFVKNSFLDYLNYDNKVFNVICRYELSVSDLQMINYTIPYPPSPAMRDMKMYPSYEEITNKEEHP